LLFSEPFPKGWFHTSHLNTSPQFAYSALLDKMAGGGGKPQNIFKLNRGNDPKEVLNWRLWFAVVSFGIMGAARGKLPNNA
jgi:hypothetical protein